MKENILVVSYDPDLSRRVADKLAESFSMRVFSAMELFEFDNVPRKLSEMIAIRGIDYVKNELAGIVKFSTDYENVVFVADLSISETCKDYFAKIISKYLVVLLKNDPQKEVEALEKKNYDALEQELYLYNLEDLEVAESALSEISDVVVNVNGKRDREISNQIVEAIKTIYNVN